MTEKTDIRDSDEKVVEIEMERLRTFKNHPFKVIGDSQMIELQDSIKKYGVLNCYIHLTTRTNAVFSGFSAFFGYGNLLYELNHFCDESSVFLFRHFYMPQFKSNS